MPGNNLKGFKVTDRERSRTCGLACKSLKQLKEKACGKFNMKESRCCLYLQDGTAVEDDDYFQTLPSQTCLVISTLDQPILTGADIIYNALKAINIQTLQAGLAVSRVIDDNIRLKIQTISDSIARTTEDRSRLSTRQEDPEWFQGLDTGAKTKEAFLRRRCSERMRGYLYKAQHDVKADPHYGEMQRSADQAINELKTMLSRRGFMGHYFDRSDEEALCDGSGLFNCDGLWNGTRCVSREGHTINPYSSREQRIVFSTWNLDHRIEKSREVIPNLIQACRRLCQGDQDPSLRINTDYFFSLFFTTDNLRLVHIVCHDKASHSAAKVDQRLVFTAAHPVKGVKRKLDQSNGEVVAMV